MDLNDFLRHTKTAAEDGNPSVKALWSGRKRASDAQDAKARATAGDESGNKRSRRSGAVDGLDIQAARDALAQERGTTSAQALEQRAQADLLSEQAASRIIHQVLEYVIHVELGGRHNAAKGGLSPHIPPAAQLAAERAMWTPAAGYAIHHVIPTALDNVPTRLGKLMSVVEREPLPDGLRALRSSLRVCDVESDLVGGVCSGMAPHLRTHVLEVLEKALRGEAWLRDDNAVVTQFASLGKSTTPQKGPSSVLLFSEPDNVTSHPDDKSNTAGENPPVSFSLTAFLTAADSDSSSSSSDV